METKADLLVFDLLKQLSQAQFEEVVLRYGMPTYWQRLNVTPSQLAQDLIRYAAQQDGAALKGLLDVILQVAPDLDVASAEIRAANPYRGLAMFELEHAAQFFGREAIAAEIASTCQRMRFLALLGASGSGKSSLLLAGVQPRLVGWQVVVCRPLGEPFKQLALALLPLLYADTLQRSAHQAELIKQLQQRKFAAVLDTLAQQQPRLLIIIDQFEELYTHNPPVTQRAFVDCLLDYAVQPPAIGDAPTLLLAMRADFLGQALAHRGFAELLDKHDKMCGCGMFGIGFVG